MGRYTVENNSNIDFYRLIEEVRKAIESELLKASSRHPEVIRKSMEDLIQRLNLENTYDILSKYYESNEELGKRLKDASNETARNQKDITDLLSDIIELLSAINKSDEDKKTLEDIRELLHGEDFELMDLVRDLKESGVVRNIRNITIAIIGVIAIFGIGSVVYSAYQTANQISSVMKRITAIDSSMVAPKSVKP